MRQKKLMDHITMGKHDGTYAEIAKLPRHPDIMANGKLDQPEGTTSQNHKKRLQWDSWFNTIVCTKSVKRDRIVHPHQNRILSVREHARAQGVPDKVKIYGGLHSGYRQMGNMVPVELGKASGLAVMKAVLGRNFTEKERQTWLLEIQGETEEEKRKREIIEKMEERGGGEVFVDLSQVWINQKCPKFTKKENEKQKGRNRTEEEEEEGRKRKTMGGQEEMEIKETFSTRIKRKKIGQEETKEEKGNEEKQNEKENKEEKDTKVDKMVEKDIGEDKIGEQEGNTMDKSERREDEVMDERNKTDDKEEDKKEERDPENKTKEKEERDEKEDQVMEERDGEERSTEVEQKETEEKEMEESRIEGKEREKKDGVIEEESKRGREEQDEIEGKEIEEEPKVDRGRKKKKIGSSDACDIVIEV
eukprot:Phypoly_transcript_01533.p2 GENE.Phypoly_transcript_01533~~Phypoly_transcript_01533.p2  ORF type:complete len:418 (-),score=156.43 Phypoly_transcript_01533:54-1307(-)